MKTGCVYYTCLELCFCHLSYPLFFCVCLPVIRSIYNPVLLSHSLQFIFFSLPSGCEIQGKVEMKKVKRICLINLKDSEQPSVNYTSNGSGAPRTCGYLFSPSFRPWFIHFIPFFPPLLPTSIPCSSSHTYTSSSQHTITAP